MFALRFFDAPPICSYNYKNTSPLRSNSVVSNIQITSKFSLNDPNLQLHVRNFWMVHFHVYQIEHILTYAIYFYFFPFPRKIYNFAKNYALESPVNALEDNRWGQIRCCRMDGERMSITSAEESHPLHLRILPHHSIELLIHKTMYVSFVVSSIHALQFQGFKVI